jgi:hypothetical protein
VHTRHIHVPCIKRYKTLSVLRKLTVEENYRLDKEEKLSKTDEKINCAAEELKTYRY